MSTAKIAFVTPPAAPAWKRWLLFSPLARIVWFVALGVGFFFATAYAVRAFGWNADGAIPRLHALAQMLVRSLPAVLAYIVVVRLIERRRLGELAPRQLLPYGLAGLVAGAVLFSVVVGILWLAGSYHVVGTNPDVDWVPAVLLVGIGAGVGEEIITRGVLFRIIEEGLGTWWALAISALFFGAAHIGNPGASWWSSLAIVIEAGLLLALLYHMTRSLWPCIGLHAAWNIMQGTVYGIPVSGGRADGWLISTRTGPDWLSGGAFGAEASVVALLVCSTLTAALLVIALRRGSIVPPSWRRPTPDAMFVGATSVATTAQERRG